MRTKGLFSFLLLAAAILVMPLASAQLGFSTLPMQGAMYSGVFSFSPNPMIAGGTETMWIEIRNVGSVVFKVTNVELKTDWAIAYYVTDIPQIIDVGKSYKFAPLSVPIPSSAVGSHTFSAAFWVQLLESSGSWAQEYQQHLGDTTVDIVKGPVVTGPTTVVLPTQQYTCDQINCYIVMQGTTVATFTGLQEKLTTQPGVDWGAMLLPLAIVLLVVLIALVGLLLYFQKRRTAEQRTIG